MTVRCRSADGTGHQTALQEALTNPLPPNKSIPKSPAEPRRSPLGDPPRPPCTCVKMEPFVLWRFSSVL